MFCPAHLSGDQCLDLTITFPCMGQKLVARCIWKAFLLLRPTRALYLLRASTSSHHTVLYRKGAGARLLCGDGLHMPCGRQSYGRKALRPRYK